MNKQKIIEDITSQWVGYGNSLVEGNKLQTNWERLVTTCVRKLEGDTQLSVIPAQTGTGKSMGVDIFLSHLCAFSTKRALLVVRQKETARQRADEIIERAKKLNPNKSIKVTASYTDTALDRDGNPVEGAELWSSEVKHSQLLVVCHAQLQLAAEEAFRGNDKTRIGNLYGELKDKRGLVIVDEELTPYLVKKILRVCVDGYTSQPGF